MNGKQYYIHLVQIDEYITELDELDMYGHTEKALGETISDSCWFSDFDSAMKVASFIAKDKHLDLNFHLEIIEEEIKIVRTRLPIGDYDDWFICPRCSNWVKSDNGFNSRYNRDETICESCFDDE